MKPISSDLVMLVSAGVADMLSLCEKQEELKVKSKKTSRGKQPERKSEEELMGESSTDSRWIVNGARIACTNAEGDSVSKVFKNEETVGVTTQKNDDLCQYDCKITPLFSKCASQTNGKCVYDLESEIWNGYDEGKSLGKDRYGLMKDEAYIVCMKGGGLIFATDDGQLVGDSGKAVALNIIRKWIEDNNISNETLREAGILASQNGINYFTALGYDFDSNFLTHGMQVLKDMELDLASNKSYIVKDANGNISVYPYYVGDGMITFGFGVAMNADSLDPKLEHRYCQMYQYYRIVYAPGVPFDGKGDSPIKLSDIPPIPLEELDQMFEYVIREGYQSNINEFVKENNLNVNQNEYDALVAMKYNMGYIPSGIRDAIVDSKKKNMSDTDARNAIYQATYNYYSTRKNANKYLKGWMNRTDELLDLYFEDI